MKLPNISIGFLGNIDYDTRTFNLFKSLKSAGHKVIFNGYDWLTPGFESTVKDDISVMKLVKGRISLLFYIRFALNLLRKLIKQNSDIYFASDLYSLPLCVIAAKLKRKKVFYDAREVYTELPALNDKKFVKSLMRIIEGHYIKKTDTIFTTGKMDSIYIENLYKLHATEVLRNLPLYVEAVEPVKYSEISALPAKNKIILYQGVVVKGRGIETYFEVVKKHKGASLVILGGGEDLEYYQKMVTDMGISERVFFAGKVSQEELLNYTAGACVGLSIISNISTNNFYALPNKLFEYIMAGIPVIVSDMPQMKEIVEKYNVGAAVPDNNADAIIDIIKEWQNSPEKYIELSENCKKASAVLNWENEFAGVYKYFNS